MKNKCFTEAKAIAPYLEAVYSHLHSHPELGRQEYQTQAFILEELKKWALKPTPLPTPVW